MGLFGGIGKALKGVDWGNVMSGLQSAGAIAHGDYGTAAQIQAHRRRERDEQQQVEAQRAATEQAIQALVARGVPEQEARIIAQGGGADTLLGQHNAPQQQGNEYTYFDDNAGNRWRQNVRTGQVDQNPTFVDRNPRQFMQDGQLITVPNSYAGQQQTAGGPQPGAVVDGFRFKGGNPNDRNSWEPVAGGAGSNAGSNFPGFNRLPGGQFRFP
jgi:hypothetical protein